MPPSRTGKARRPDARRESRSVGGDACPDTATTTPAPSWPRTRTAGCPNAQRQSDRPALRRCLLRRLRLGLRLRLSRTPLRPVALLFHRPTAIGQQAKELSEWLVELTVSTLEQHLAKLFFGQAVAGCLEPEMQDLEHLRE